jgi:DNA-3-methyladenine glycosylase
MTTSWQWLNAPVEEAARRLLGSELVRELDDTTLRVRIVEVEAYDQADAASHTFRGRTVRNDAMFRSAGHAYVYLSHGIHYCLNVVTGVDGYGSGVLIRAVQPLAGEEIMEKRRGRTGIVLTNGPGKLCQALGVTRELSGHDLALPPLMLVRCSLLPPEQIVTTTRIGISKATDELRRFYIAGNPYVSKL